MPRFNAENEGKAKQTVLKAILIKHGISNVPVDCFHVGGYRYSDLVDAVAHAKRISSIGN